MKTLSSLFLALGLAITIPAAMAENKQPAKETHKKAPAKKAAPAEKKAAPAVIDEEDKVPDVSADKNTDYHCELGNQLTVYRNAEDDKHIALRWKKQLLRLTRVETTTGANRFENKKNGWVWIDIPAKAMLLDSKKGQQLANECRNPEQMTQKTADASTN